MYFFAILRQTRAITATHADSVPSYTMPGRYTAAEEVSLYTALLRRFRSVRRSTNSQSDARHSPLWPFTPLKKVPRTKEPLLDANFIRLLLQTGQTY